MHTTVAKTLVSLSILCNLFDVEASFTKQITMKLKRLYHARHGGKMLKIYEAVSTITYQIFSKKNASYKITWSFVHDFD